MSGQVDGTVYVRVTYGDPWTHDDAERLVMAPVLAEIDAAAQKIAEAHSVPGRVTVTVV